MTHGTHSHGPSVSAGAAHKRSMLLVLGITCIVLVAEIVGAQITGSLALLADAGHMFVDIAGITLALIAVAFASRPATDARTYGYYRVEIFAAVINSVLLLTVALFILFEAWQRWNSPPAVQGGLMLAFATVGLITNGIGILILRAGSKESLNVKGAYLDVFADTLGSLAVIAAAVIISVTGWDRADAVASAVVALIILPRTWSLLREAIDVLLEATPRGIDVGEVRRHILETPGVIAEHDLHIWTLTSGIPVLSVHVVVADEVVDQGQGGIVLDALGECLGHHFDIEHCTFQLEPAGHSEHEHGIHH